MTATDELRQLLNERGVGYAGTHPAFTGWWGNYDLYWSAMEVYEGELDLGTNMSNVSPEQAIEATLGRGECHIEHYDTDMFDGERYYRCSACHSERIEWGDKYCPNCGRVVSE